MNGYRQFFFPTLTASLFLLTPHIFYPAAESKFQAPKLAFSTALAAAMCLAGAGFFHRPTRETQRLGQWLALVFAGMCVSAALSPFPGACLFSLAAAGAFMAAFFVCAIASASVSQWSFLYEGLVHTFALAAAMALAQRAGIFLPGSALTDPSAAIGNENLYAGCLAMTFPLALGGALHGATAPRRAACAISSIVLGAGLAFARVLAPLAAAVAGAGLVLAPIAARPWNRGGLMGLLAAATIAFSALVFVGNPKAWMEKAEKTATSYAASSRMEHWSAAAKMWKDRPILGWGPGNFLTSFKKNYQKTKMGFDLLQTHNEYLQALVEMGIVAPFVLAGGGWFVVRRIRRVKDEEPWNREKVWSVAGGLTAGAVFAFFSFPLHHAAAGVLIFSLFSLLFLRTRPEDGMARTEEPGPGPFGSSRRPALAVWLLISAATLAAPWLAFRGLRSEIHIARALEAVKTGDPGAALVQARNASAANPYNGYARFLHGTALIQAKKLNEAKTELEAAGRLRDFKALHYALGLCYQELGLNEKAQKEYVLYRERL